MPLVKLSICATLTDAKRDAILKAASAAVAKATGKPEAYMMCVIEPATIVMAGKPGPAAFADVRGIGGFNRTVNSAITRALCDLLHTELGIVSDRVYATFTNVDADFWGCNGETFG
jgi:phenylpyruvate tautomerase PptA (4-oxalocrotonate tautomerase family)